jgi:hypothetical protein
MTVSDIVSGMVANARSEIAKARLQDAERPIGTEALDIDFYSAADSKKPVEDYDFTDASGRRFKGFGARWCAIKVKWTGSDWRRVRRLTGPLQFTEALTRCSELADKLGLERRP